MKIISLLKKLGKLSLPEIEQSSHRSDLRSALLQSKYFHEERFSLLFKLSTIIHKFKTMSFLKKSFSIGTAFMIAIAVITVQLNFFPAPSVNAQEIINKTITHIDTLNSDEAKFKRELLEMAKNSKALHYVGEEILPNGKKVQKLSFKDENIGTEVAILVDTESDFVELSLEKKYLPFETHNFEIKNNNIQHLDLLSKLQDEQIHNDVALWLIQQENKQWLEKYSYKLDPPQKEIFAAILPKLHMATVLLKDINWSINNDKIDSVLISSYRLTNSDQEEGAKNAFGQAVEKLKKSQTETAHIKFNLLEELDYAHNLQYLGEDNLIQKDLYKQFPEGISEGFLQKVKRFALETEKGIVHVLLNEDIYSDDALILDFKPPMEPSITVEGELKDGEIIEPKKIINALTSSKNAKLGTLIQEQNQRFISGYFILSKDAEDSYSATLSAESKVVKVLAPLLEKSHLLITNIEFKKDFFGNVTGFVIVASPIHIE